jgi:asparagine synthase (glutamine-hydrolysing)
VALDFLLAEGYAASPMTLVEGVARLPAGEVLVATAPGRHRLEGFARYSGQPKVSMGRTERTRRFGELFEQAVRRRVNPDQATGVLVSSGIDSTLTLAVLTRVLGVPARAYTFRYEDYSGLKNESDGARRAADYLRAPHTEIAISAAGVMEAAPRLVREYGEPFTFGLHSYELGPVAADGVEVLFSGQGRDYLMSRAQRLQARYGALPTWVRRPLEVIPAVARPAPPLARRIRSVIDGRASWGARIYGEQTTPATVRAALYGADQTAAYRRAAVALLEHSADRFRDEAPLDRLLLPGQRLRGNDLYTLWNHWWGDAHGIAVRQPFRDRELLDFTYRLKHPELRKMEQRRYAESLLPREVAYEPKRHQLPPLAEWLREGGPLLGYAREQLGEERVASSGLFEAGAVGRLVDAHASGRANHEWTIWVLIATLLWRDEVLEPAGAGS